MVGMQVVSGGVFRPRVRNNWTDFPGQVSRRVSSNVVTPMTS
jgi:hypothetical protein